MKGRSALATTFGFLLLAHAGSVWAQDEEEEEASEEESTGEEAASEEEGAEAAPEEAAAEESAAAPSGRWPRSVIARPLTMPKGLAHVGVTITPNKDFKVIGLGLDGGYGVSDDLEAVVGYGLGLKAFEAKGTLSVGAGYKVLRGAAGGKLEVIGRGTFGYSVLGKALSPIVLGAQVQYNISDKLAVVSSGRNLSIALEGTVKPITLGIPVGVGFQATPELYVQADTTIATINISDSATTVIFSDTTPLVLTAFYNVMPALDVSAGLRMDVTPAVGGVGDTLGFLIGARYYLGAL
jgi:hypothetical protein